MNQMIITLDSLEAKERAYSALIPLAPEAGYSMMLCRDSYLEPASADIRKKAQNDLMWVWNKQISEFTGSKIQFVHGLNKLQLLLPLYKSWGGKSRDRAHFIESVLDCVPNFNTKIGVAYDMIRTRDLSIPKMAAYLTGLRMEAADNGIVLESNSDLEFKNLMMYAEKKA